MKTITEAEAKQLAKLSVRHAKQSEDEMDEKQYYDLIELCKVTKVKRLGVNSKTFTDFISVFGKHITDQSFRTFRRSGSFTLPVSFVVDGIEIVEIII